ncbi:ABC transporter substrate-binding protein [Plantibacter sp. Mn2098]|uniref:ABC transporter substrate-binding protein n=1 Tax=Plantibacter sp. Mn2098 TaxID=3395266 RepID=UPI003BC52348
MKHHARTAKTALVVGVVAVSSLLFTACSTPGGSGSDTQGELRILANITPALTKEYYQKLVEPFVKSHPGVTVTIESPSGKDVQSTLQQELASGATPDIVASNLDPVVAPQMTAFPDTDWVKATPLAEENKVDGKIWQVATGAQIQSLVYYNKDAFTKAGITEPPTSLKEFTADLALLQGAGYVPLQTAGEWVTGAQFAMMANPELLGSDPDWYAKRNEKKVTFADSAYATYLDAYADWIASGGVAKDALGVKYQDSINNFVAGKSATFVMGNWLVPELDAAKLGFEVGVFATPTIDGSAPKQLSGAAQPYSILKNSKHQKLALELVQYLVSDKDAIATSLKSEGNFRQGVTYEGSPLNTEVAGVLDASPGSVIGTSGPGINSGFGNELNTAVQSLYTGKSGKEAAAALDEWWDANVAK